MSEPKPTIQIEELSPILRRVSVELPPAAVDEALAQAYLDLSRTVKVNGFRPGKAPRRVLERSYRSAVEREVIATLIDQGYRAALEEQDLFPLAEPVVENVTLTEGQPFRFRAQVEVKPKLDPKDYLGLPLALKPVAVTEAELDGELEKLRESMAQLRPIEERQVGVAGDWALVDYTLEVEGVAMDKLEKNVDQPVELVDGEITKGHIPELRGVEVGQTITVTHVFPADHKLAELRGKTGNFRVTLKGLRKREVPPLDDELVKDLDDPELSTVAELRERLRGRLSDERQELSARDGRQQLERALIARNPFEAPPALIARAAEGQLRTLAQQIVRAGIDPDSLSIDQAKLRADAEQRIRAELLLEAVATKEGLAVEEADYEAYFQSVAEVTEQPVGKVRSQFGRSREREALTYKLLGDKALAFLRAKASISDLSANPAVSSPEGVS